MEPSNWKFQSAGSRQNLTAGSSQSSLAPSSAASSSRVAAASANMTSKPTDPADGKSSFITGRASPQPRDAASLFSRPRTAGGTDREGGNERGFPTAPAYPLGSPILSPPTDPIGHGTMGKAAFRNRPTLERRPSPRREVLTASPQEESEGSSSEEREQRAKKGATKGSVIGKVARRAKLVLPLKRVQKDPSTGNKIPEPRSSPLLPTTQPSARKPEEISDSPSESSDESESEAEEAVPAHLKEKTMPDVSYLDQFAAPQQPLTRRIVPPETLMRDDDELERKKVPQKPSNVSSLTLTETPESIPLRSKTTPNMSQTALTSNNEEDNSSNSNVGNTIAEPRRAQEPSSQASQSRNLSTPSLENMSTLKPNVSNKSSSDLGLSPIPETSVLNPDGPTRSTSPNPTATTKTASNQKSSSKKTKKKKKVKKKVKKSDIEASMSWFKVPKSTSAFNFKPDPPAPPPEPAYQPRAKRHPPTQLPALYDAEKGPKVEPAPPGAMYWSRARSLGHDRLPVRAHAMCTVGSNIYVFGGCDSKACFNELAVLDADCMYWTTPPCQGTIPLPLRAMTMNTVGKKIVIFGGGDGPSYFNDVYVLDTVNLRYKKPKINGPQPSKRRAHTACVYKGGLYVFGGGDGVRALNDVWRLDLTDLNRATWKLISAGSSSRATTTTTTAKGKDGLTTTKNVSASSASPSRPTARGYHTANMVGSKLIVYGGSDGVDCFRDVWIFDVETLVWKSVNIEVSFPRLSHTATVVGSYLFVFGGHDGVEYSNDLLLLNLVTMQWDKRKVYGAAPSPRGYHAAVLYDSRLFVVGGYDGRVFDDTFLLDLGISAYYSQISNFTIDV